MVFGGGVCACEVVGVCVLVCWFVGSLCALLGISGLLGISFLCGVGII